jgi:hypothetical protein
MNEPGDTHGSRDVSGFACDEHGGGLKRSDGRRPLPGMTARLLTGALALAWRGGRL